MSPRRSRRRRALAAPFVFTVALAPACMSKEPPASKPDPQPETRFDQNGNEITTKPMTTGEPTKPAGNNTDAIGGGNEPAALPDAPADGGRVVTNDDGSCWFYYEVECPPDTKCNPPAPKQVKCPK